MKFAATGSIEQPGLLKADITCFSPWRIGRYSNNRMLLGVGLYFFAEKVIRKYKLFDDYGFDPVALVFLQNLYEEAEKHNELTTRVEQTLRLLILWNQQFQVKDQLICHHNVYLSNLINEIELHLSYIKQLSIPQYNQLHKLYSSETTEQNLTICQTLISQLSDDISTSVGANTALRDNQIVKNISVKGVGDELLLTKGNAYCHFLTHFWREKQEKQEKQKNNIYSFVYDQHHPIYKVANSPQIPTVTGSLLRDQQHKQLVRTGSADNASHGALVSIQAIQPYSLTHSFQTILEGVAEVSHLPNSRELFYFSVRDQLIDHFIENHMLEKEIGSYEQEILLDGSKAQNSPADQGQLLEHLKNADEGEFAAISQRVLETENIGEYGVLQQLIQQLFPGEHRGGIPQLISSCGQLSREVQSFLEKKELTKRELLHIIENGPHDEKVLVYNALKFAAKKVAEKQTEQTDKTLVENISVRNKLLQNKLLENIENNEYDFSEEYQLEENRLTLMQYLSSQEHSVWNELEEQINQYKTTVAKQLNKISVLDSLSSPTMTKNEIITILKDTKDEGLFHKISAAFESIADGEGKAAGQYSGQIYQMVFQNIIDGGGKSTVFLSDTDQAVDMINVNQNLVASFAQAIEDQHHPIYKVANSPQIPTVTGSLLRDQQHKQLVRTGSADNASHGALVSIQAIQPYSLTHSFQTILEGVAEVSHLPNSRELFYFSVRDQLIDHFIENHMLKKEIGAYEQEILLDGSKAQDSPADRGQLLEHLKNADEGEFAAISQRVLETENIGEYGVLQQLIQQLFPGEYRGGIPQLISNCGQLSREVRSFLEKKELTKRELLHIIENGPHDEIVLVYNALKFAAKKIAEKQTEQTEQTDKTDKTLVENISVRNKLLQNKLLENIENNEYDFSEEYQLEENRLTLMQYLSSQEHSVWNELEKQINQYKTTVAKQLNKISVLDSLSSPTMTKNEIITILRDTKNEGLFHKISAAFESIADGGGKATDQYSGQIYQTVFQNIIDGREKSTVFLSDTDQAVDMINVNQNLAASLAQAIEDQQFINSPLLQYRSSEEADGFTADSLAPGTPDSINTSFMNLVRRLGNDINPTRHEGANTVSGSGDVPGNHISLTKHRAKLFSVYDQHHPIYKVGNSLQIPTVTGSLLRDKQLVSIRTAREVTTGSNVLTLQGDHYAGNNAAEYISTVKGQTDITNHVVRELYAPDKVQQKERADADIAQSMPSQRELIEQFGNLIYSQDMSSSESIDRQAGSVLTESSFDISAELSSIPELVKRVIQGEQLLRGEQRKVTALSKKIKEQEAVINKMDHAHTQLQEDVAAKVNKKKIKSMVMKDLRAKIRLDRMRYGLQ